MPLFFMALLIAAICLLYFYKSKPAFDLCDRFGLLFLEARDSAITKKSEMPKAEKQEDGTYRLLPLSEQDENTRSILSAGSGDAFAEYDRQLEGILRALFEAIGTNGHLKTHYYDYFNSLFILHRNFLSVCVNPGGPISSEAWEDLKTYWADRVKLINLIGSRLTNTGQKELKEMAMRKKSK